MPPALVSRADIVEVGLDCKPVDPNAPRLNGERFIHCQVYKARGDVQSVIHTHDLAVIPFGLTGIALKPVLAQAGFLPPQVPLFEVREANASEPETKRGMLVLNAILGDALAKKLGHRSRRPDARPWRNRRRAFGAGSDGADHLHSYRRASAERGAGAEPQHHGFERCRIGDQRR